MTQLQQPQLLPYRPPRRDDPSAYAGAVAWYDSLSEVQRVVYGIGLILFLLACSGYLLGLGSTILLRRVQAEELAQSMNPPAVAVGTPEERPTPPAAPGAFVAMTTAAATPTPGSAGPLPTPFAGPQLTQGPLVPRVAPAPQSNGVPLPAPPRPATAAPTPATPAPRTPPASVVVSPAPARTAVTTPSVVTTAVSTTPGPTPTNGAAGTPPPVASTPTAAAPPTATAPAKPTLPPPTPTQSAPPPTPPRPTNTPLPSGGSVAPAKP